MQLKKVSALLVSTIQGTEIAVFNEGLKKVESSNLRVKLLLLMLPENRS